MERLGHTESTGHLSSQTEVARNRCLGSKVVAEFCQTYETVLEIKTSPARRKCKQNMSDSSIGAWCTPELLWYPA